MRSDDVTRPRMVAWLGYGGLLAHCWQDLRLQLTLIASICLTTVYFFGPVPVSQGITV